MFDLLLGIIIGIAVGLLFPTDVYRILDAIRARIRR